MKIIDKIIPSQEKGWNTNTKETVELETASAAKQLYDLGKERLVDVNKWHLLDTDMPAKFWVIDSNGKELDRKAQKDDFIKIKLGGPATEAGEGFDWVQVERMGEIKKPEEDSEVTFMILHPAKNPVAGEAESTAHFFTEHASGCFIVNRDKNKVTAGVYGRNEKPNVSTGKVLDNVRNALVALGSFVGFAKLQWKILVKALIA